MTGRNRDFRFSPAIDRRQPHLDLVGRDEDRERHCAKHPREGVVGTSRGADHYSVAGSRLVIHPEECIDCGVCEPECPVYAIKPDTEPGLEKWLSLNAEYAKIWPNITVKRTPPPDWKEWEGKPDKLQYFSPNPGTGD